MIVSKGVIAKIFLLAEWKWLKQRPDIIGLRFHVAIHIEWCSLAIADDISSRICAAILKSILAAHVTSEFAALAMITNGASTVKSEITGITNLLASPSIKTRIGLAAPVNALMFSWDVLLPTLFIKTRITVFIYLFIYFNITFNKRAAVHCSRICISRDEGQNLR